MQIQNPQRVVTGVNNTLDAMVHALQKAGDVLLTQFTNPHLRQSFKDSTTHNYESLVTQADSESQHVIKKSILDYFKENGINNKEIGFIGEEDSLTEIKKHMFIIDPLDGTTNYSKGIRHFSISIANMENGSIQRGVIYEPFGKILYFAEKGKGAYKLENGKRELLQVMYVKLKDSLVSAHLNTPTVDTLFQVYQKLYPQTAGLRNEGSLVLDLCALADNQYGVVINGGTSIWDLAAGKIILEESGGVLVDWEGKPIIYDSQNPRHLYQCIACHPDNLQSILTIFSENN
jgi:myo-inositol-1(or 4)-monophosphatase